MIVTESEVILVTNLAKCSMLTGTFERNFLRSLAKIKIGDSMSDSQFSTLLDLKTKYRVQLSYYEY